MIELKKKTLNCLQQCKRILNESNNSLEKCKDNEKISTVIKNSQSSKMKIKITEGNNSTIHIPLTEVTKKLSFIQYWFHKLVWSFNYSNTKQNKN